MAKFLKMNEELILKFDAVLEEYNSAYAQATSDEEREKINDIYEVKISEAEAVLEKELEEQFQQEITNLEKEQLASEKELLELEEIEEEEIDLDKLRAELAEKYTVKELKAILREAGIKGYSKLKEAELINLIVLNKLY